MNKSPAFQWYPKDILASARVQMMSMTEECAYRRLIDYCWINGSVPSDPHKAARLVGKGCSVEAAKVALEMFIPHETDADKLIHDRLEVEREKQESNSRVRQAAAEARWNKQGTSKREVEKQANGKQVKSKSDANAMQTDMQNDALQFSSSSSFANNLNGSGSSSNARGSGKPPPTAADSFPKNGQWIELDEAEKIMSKKEFVDHLQRLHPTKNVRAIGKKLKEFCDRHGKAFALERLKGWTVGEAETFTDAEFLAAFGDDEKQIPAWQKAINNCDLCDEKGLAAVGGRLTPCGHEKVEK